MRLQGKVPIVTGAGKGNGRVLALGLAREGTRVVVALTMSWNRGGK